ncbi:conserved oligomeric Golgi complex subunit 7-like isoform X3 [Ostrea edulis]|uniref:conserved oligomeric Golgi complex subunit 7-like isoform X3 n=1 Tax=Ostrea edulis TaxID=37623 RepID=UPI0024AEE065|nr:conserved oligomeric Golgi complex subunit 7-like isoform X3 [Ostrea edulis]
MDYSKFLDDNFDTKEWVNSAFRSQKDPSAAKDQYATTLVMKLQMFIQEVNNIIEETSQQSVQNLPRVMRELDAVKQEAALLQDQMKMVKEDIQKVEHDTAKSMQTLLKLDAIKSLMTSTAEALKEADNWTTLSSDVEEVFQSQDIKAITMKLKGMQNSLLMLVDTPDYGDRCQHLETLKNRLEAILSPQLVQAFNTQSLETAQMYTQIFTDIDRVPQLYKYYSRCHKVTLLNTWKNTMEANADDTLKEWMTEYYDQLLSTWHTQMKWCKQVFPDPLPIVCDLITETMKSLDPPLYSCVNLYIQHRDTLAGLIELKQITERFARSMEQAVESNMKADNTNHVTSLDHLLLELYAPYRQYISTYQSLEEDKLGKDLESIKLDHEEIFETVQLLAVSVNKLFNFAKEANDRCLNLTNGCGYVFMMDSLKTYFSNYCKEFRRVLTNIKEKCRTSRRAGEEEDWTHFQHTLRIIQTCGDLIMHMDELDGNIVSCMMQTIAHYTNPSSPVKEIGKLRCYYKSRCEIAEEIFFGKVSALEAHASLFLGNPHDIENLEGLVTRLGEGDMPSVLEDTKKELCKLSEDVHKFSFDIVFATLRGYLADVCHLEIWTSKSAGGALTSDLPTFSLSPQEYITKVGQYLMTLPQHLEPFTMQDNPSVLVALKHGKLPYTDETELPEHVSDLWLESIARGTMHLYSEQILKIHELSNHATKQIITDIDYLCNVLDDLGLHASDTLKNIDTLLKAPQEDYLDIAESMPQRLSHAISTMRNIEL